jgi:hypothetical protein
VAGDLNGDGIADIVERDLVPGGNWRLRAISGFDATVLWTYAIPGAPPSGVILADGRGPFAAGDVDGDGKGDVVAGSAYGSGVYVVSGANGSLIWSLQGSPGNTLYMPEGAGPDLDGNGIGDVLVRYIFGWAGWGWAEVRSGSNGAVIGSVTLTSQYWAPIAFLPDASGDGSPDVIVSRSPSPSLVSIYTGPSLSLAHTFAQPPLPPFSPPVSQNFGNTVGTPGDVNGDGLVEIAIGSAPILGPPPVPAVYYPMSTRIMAGGTWNLLYELSGTTTWGAGGRIESLGDIDGDGAPEFSLSAAGVPVGLGGASILSGPTGTVVWSAPSTTVDALIVSRCVDLNQDGVRESVLLEPYDDFAATDAGRLRVVSWNPPPSASVTDLGGACGQSGGSLSLGLPRIGASCTVAMTGGVPFVAGNLAADFASDVTTVLPSGCVGHLDPAHYVTWTLIPIATDAAGGFSFSVTVPTIPIAAGTTVTLQVALFGTSSPMGFDLSNGVRAVLGF